MYFLLRPFGPYRHIKWVLQRLPWESVLQLQSCNIERHLMKVTDFYLDKNTHEFQMKRACVVCTASFFFGTNFYVYIILYHIIFLID